jgi:hypothetical protein
VVSKHILAQSKILGAQRRDLGITRLDMFLFLF